MTIIDLAVARDHLRLPSDYPAVQIEGKLEAAEEHAAQYLNRRIFAEDDALAAAVAAVPTELINAGVAYDDAILAASDIQNTVARSAAIEYATATYRSAQTNARETYAGIVINRPIEAGILLILGHLFENRQDVQAVQAVQLPIGSEQLLFPYRVGLGV